MECAYFVFFLLIFLFGYGAFHLIVQWFREEEKKRQTEEHWNKLQAEQKEAERQEFLRQFRAELKDVEEQQRSLNTPNDPGSNPSGG